MGLHLRSLVTSASSLTGVRDVGRERGITVTNTPDVLTEDTADMTMGLILAVSRRLTEGERRLRSGDWHGWAPTSMLGHRIYGKRLGIVGMGRIGQALALPQATAPCTTAEMPSSRAEHFQGGSTSLINAKALVRGPLSVLPAFVLAIGIHPYQI